MKNSILIMLAALVLHGCAILPPLSPQKIKLDKAVSLLEQGKTTEATELLAILCSETGIPRITDEALFRLGLLRLGTVQEKSDMLQARRNLNRLIKEYPASSWTPMAANLIDYLESAEDIRQQNRKAKELNLSIAKENKDLRQSLEKLKNLELELGKKIKR